MKGTCSPDAGTLYNQIVLAKWNATFVVTVKWLWDGLSLYPNCRGSVESITVENKTGKPQSLFLEPALEAARRMIFSPGSTVYEKAVLTTMALRSVADVGGIVVRKD